MTGPRKTMARSLIGRAFSMMTKILQQQSLKMKRMEEGMVARQKAMERIKT